MATLGNSLAACGLGVVLGLGMTTSTAEAKPISEKVGRRVSRGVVDESLAALDTPKNRERIGNIINSPQMRKAMHDLAHAIVIGVFDGVRQARKSGSIGDDIDEHVTPAVTKLTRRVVDAAMTAALADKHIAQVEKLGEATTHAVVTGLATGIEHELGPALAATLEKDLGPAIGRMLERDILPALGRGLDSPEVQSAVGNSAHTIATELVAGTDDQMAREKQKDEAAGKPSGLTVFGGRVALGYAIALFVAFAFGTLLVVVTVMLVRSNRRQRKQETEARRRETTLLHLLDNIESDHPELRTDVHRLVREQLHTEPEP